jgi:hypothetical protein
MDSVYQNEVRYLLLTNDATVSKGNTVILVSLRFVYYFFFPLITVITIFVG